MEKRTGRRRFGPVGPRISRGEGVPASAAMLLLALISTVVPSTATAQSAHQVLDVTTGAWEMVERAAIGTIYLDARDIVPLDPEVYQVRTLWRFTKAQADHEGEAYSSSVAVRAIDCRGNAMAILAFADQNGVRTVNGGRRSLVAAQWTAIGSGTIVERIAAKVCRPRGEKMSVPRTMVGG